MSIKLSKIEIMFSKKKWAKITSLKQKWAKLTHTNITT